MKKKIKEIIQLIFLSICLFLLTDYFFGRSIVEKFYWKKKENFRIDHNIYHHTIKKNYNGDAYVGGRKYKFCSDSNGFKSSCVKLEKKEKVFDIAFIGDSFTEGLGLEYENTFVGMIANQLKKKKIANLGVSSYSPSIYYMKIKKYLEDGYFFKDIVVYIDINDIHNEANAYKIINDSKVISNKEGREKIINYLDDGTDKFKFKKFFRDNFIFTYENLHLLKYVLYRIQKKKEIFPYLLDLNYGKWTYDNKVRGYGSEGLEQAIIKTQNIMIKLFDLLDSYKITYSIGVYPYPQTLYFDTEHSRHVKIWKDLCQNRCKNFYNNFPTFFGEVKKIGLVETYYKYYIYRDVHLNKEGNKVIADNFLKNY